MSRTRRSGQAARVSFRQLRTADVRANVVFARPPGKGYARMEAR